MSIFRHPEIPSVHIALMFILPKAILLCFLVVIPFLIKKRERDHSHKFENNKNKSRIEKTLFFVKGVNAVGIFQDMIIIRKTPSNAIYRKNTIQGKIKPGQ
jgi:hypothetical protein